ncbi:GAF domain-containing sensor histidine kinase [Pedobacter agri]|uniref:histidine kinase n=1 Tax=Pedobacter agri TaxID=454586 RepID=A0A9X3DD99_9SPHI|nr:HAMP domain-containing sensor histidine kinase [Pedobacter agri]MCX3265549.1 HAMP domain-containing sensor histidine kinase [Pedobacter agri]
MFKNIIPANEDLRLRKLIYYEILDSPAEQSFDGISTLAADIFDAKNAGICFVTDEDIFVKSRVGDSIKTQRNDRLIAQVILQGEVLVIEHEPTDQTIIPLVAAPIKSPDGFNIGAIYVFGSDVKKPTEKQKKMLMQLAELVIDKLETRIAIRKTLTAQDDRLHVLIHDLKNPMTTISLQSELVSRMPNIDEKAGLIASKINQQAKRMVDNLNEILSSAKKVGGSFKPKKEKVDLSYIVKLASQNLESFAKKKNQTINFEIESGLEIFGDIEKLTELFYHVIHNAVKFSGPETEISFSHQTHGNLITIAVKDQGVGLTPGDLELLFIKFARLSAQPTQNENSNGLGLTLVKMFVDMHKGKLWAESGGKNKGTTVYIQLPIK